MEHTRYIARKRARFQGISGPVNIPFGTLLEARDGLIFHNSQPLCTVTGQNAHDYFSQNDDGQGQARGRIVGAILKRLLRKEYDTGDYQARWDKVWADRLCRKYRKREQKDHWLWNHDFYNAPVDDLQHIAELIDARA